MDWSANGLECQWTRVPMDWSANGLEWIYCGDGGYAWPAAGCAVYTGGGGAMSCAMCTLPPPFADAAWAPY